MSKLEKLDNQMFQALTDNESNAILGGAFTFIGLTDRDGQEYDDYKSGDSLEAEEVQQTA